MPPADARFTLVGDDAAEEVVARDLRRAGERVREALGSSLSALLLVGGYARGEGSMVVRDGGWAAYNDYDLVAVVETRSVARRARLALGRVAEELTYAAGVEVDLWPMARSDLRSAPRTLFWLDASRSTRLVVGDAAVLGEIPRRGVRDVPLAEAGRLLSNRAVGLALSNLEPTDRDFRRLRHAHKAALACGDVHLIAADRYPPTVAERAAELRRLIGAPGVDEDLASAYDRAVSFRRRPDSFEVDGDPSDWYDARREQIGRWHLGFEAFRANTPLDAMGYARHPRPLFRDADDLGPAGPAAVLAWASGAAPLRPYVGHPRERLARAAVALAYAHQDEACRRIAESLLGSASRSDDALHARLQGLAARAG